MQHPGESRFVVTSVTRDAEGKALIGLPRLPIDAERPFGGAQMASGLKFTQVSHSAGSQRAAADGRFVVRNAFAIPVPKVKDTELLMY